MSTPLRSFIEVAPESHFPLRNLPYGIFRPHDGPARAGVAIGDLVLDLAVLEEGGYFHALDFGERPIFRASRALYFEWQTAFSIGPRNKHGEPVPIAQAVDHIFGLVLMNDWSARDIQTWEYQPLGPFLAKNFCTSISPWVVTLEALEPFRKLLPKQDPEPLPYLRAKNDFTFDIQLEAKLQTAKMKSPHVITLTNFPNLYWSISQHLAHHTIR